MYGNNFWVITFGVLISFYLALISMQYLLSPKILNLSDSHDFIEIPDFSCAPNLERLILKDCTRLIDVHENIGFLDKLICLSVKDCKNLMNLPENISILFRAAICFGNYQTDRIPTDILDLVNQPITD